MRYLSLFSGIEAASVAWGPLGWEPVAFCEIDEFPSAVLAYRFPNVPNLGDITKVDWYGFYKKHGAVDVMVGGSPCQSFSIAGNREGRAGESGLMAEYIRCVRELVSASGGGAPRYIVWENVPGALSSERGVAFGQLLAELGELGYGLAWRVLDAQFVRVPDGSADGFFGPVPQRRRRVFLVGSLGSPGAAEILFERSCLRGDHPKGAEARKALAEDAHGRAGTGDFAGFKYHAGKCAGGIGYEVGTSPTLTADYHNPAVVSLQSDGSTSQNSHGSGYCDDGSAYTCNTIDRQAIAFAQNQRGEVRLFGGGGSTVGALAAQPGMKQTSYVMTDTQPRTTVDDEQIGSLCARMFKDPPVVAMADDNGKSAVDVEMCGSLKVGGGSR